MMCSNHIFVILRVWVSSGVIRYVMVCAKGLITHNYAYRYVNKLQHTIYNLN